MRRYLIRAVLLFFIAIVTLAAGWAYQEISKANLPTCLSITLVLFTIIGYVTVVAISLNGMPGR